MNNCQRRSPVSFSASPIKSEERDGWEVVLEYEGEGNGPYFIDLSHRARWDLQSRNLSEIRPWGVRIPDRPGSCILENGLLVNRMNPGQASIWHLWGDVPGQPDRPEFTAVTEAAALLALAGRGVFSVIEKLSALDLSDPKKTAPFLLQGPVVHVPCQLVVLERSQYGGTVLFTCSRGYAQDMVEAVSAAGDEFELRPAGETAFTNHLNRLL